MPIDHHRHDAVGLTLRFSGRRCEPCTLAEPNLGIASSMLAMNSKKGTIRRILDDKTSEAQTFA
jgi:hypothetical protein